MLAIACGGADGGAVSGGMASCLVWDLRGLVLGKSVPTCGGAREAELALGLIAA